MKIFHSLKELSDSIQSGMAVTFGNFDGVHRGHQELLGQLSQKAQELGLKLVVVTFHPHPQKILKHFNSQYLLTGREQKLELLSKAGVDYIVEIPFTRDFSSLGAEEFLLHHVFVTPSIKSLFLGWDFAFGANKSGDKAAIKTILQKHGMDQRVSVHEFPNYAPTGTSVSSSQIRSLIGEGKVFEANQLLGRAYGLEGLIVKGQGRGKIIGIPTANLACDPDILVPMRGVYVTETLYRGMKYRSITNIGVNPTFDGDKTSVETHILNFDRDIYGETLQVQFLKKIRDEIKFPNVNSLIEQITKDIGVARSYVSP